MVKMSEKKIDNLLFDLKLLAIEKTKNKSRGTSFEFEKYYAIGLYASYLAEFDIDIDIRYEILKFSSMIDNKHFNINSFDDPDDEPIPTMKRSRSL